MCDGRVSEDFDSAEMTIPNVSSDLLIIVPCSIEMHI